MCVISIETPYILLDLVEVSSTLLNLEIFQNKTQDATGEFKLVFTWEKFIQEFSIP